VRLTHTDEQGAARMVDVGDKPVSTREAVAEGQVRMSAEAFALVQSNTVAKGDVLGIARIAGIAGAKRTSDLVPLCHPIVLDLVEVDAEADASLPGVRVRARTRATARTGVEMEALAAVMAACLTVYDMVKAVDRSMRIEDVRLRSKTGGTRGDWTAPAGD
jgi:cyclic pyranopterin phosphate synthase